MVPVPVPVKFENFGTSPSKVSISSPGPGSVPAKLKIFGPGPAHLYSMDMECEHALIIGEQISPFIRTVTEIFDWFSVT